MVFAREERIHVLVLFLTFFLVTSLNDIALHVSQCSSLLISQSFGREGMSDKVNSRVDK